MKFKTSSILVGSIGTGGVSGGGGTGVGSLAMQNEDTIGAEEQAYMAAHYQQNQKQTTAVIYSTDSGNNSEELLTSASASPSNSSSDSNHPPQQHKTCSSVPAKLTTAATAPVAISSNNSRNAIDSAVRQYGWLSKLSQNGLKLWRKRYFVLTDYILDYYSDSTMAKHCGTIFLNGTRSRTTLKKEDGSAFNKKNSFKVCYFCDFSTIYCLIIKIFEICHSNFCRQNSRMTGLSYFFYKLNQGF